MINRDCTIGKKTKAARRMAGFLMTGTMAGSILAGAAGGLQVSAATWQENADYIFEYLTQRLGYSEAAACGIMANIRCESTFNPHAWNAGGGSYGLCQWTGGRYGRLQNWCRSNGFDYTTIDGQLSYLEYELENHYPGVEQYLRSVENNSDGAYDAGQYYCYHFEAPASRGSVSVYRGGLASGTFWESYRPAEWYKVDGVWHYILRDGSYQKQWLTIDDETFYLDDEGNRISGWRSIDGNRYYFDSDGVMVSGWQKIDGKSYYFAEDGSLVTGLTHSGDDWYLLDEYGSLKASADMERFAPVWIASAQINDETVSEADTIAAAQENAQEGLVSDSGLTVGDASISVAENASGALTAFNKVESAGSVVESNTVSMIPFAAPQEQVPEEDNISAVEALLLAARGTMEEEDTVPENSALASSIGTEMGYTEAEADVTPDDITEEEPVEIVSELVENADLISDEQIEEVMEKETEKASEGATDKSINSEETDPILKEQSGQSEESSSGRTEEKAEKTSAAATEEQAESAATAATAEQAEKAAAAATEEQAEEAAATATAEQAEKAATTATAEKAEEAAIEEQAEESSADTKTENKPESVSGESEDQKTEEQQTEEQQAEEASGHVIPETLSTEGISLSEMESTRREESGEEQQERILITLSEEIPPMPPRKIPVLVETLREKKILRAVTQSGLDITPEVTSEVLEVPLGADKAVVAFRAEYHGNSAEIIVDVPIAKED